MLLCQIQYLALLPRPSVHAHARNEIPVPPEPLSRICVLPLSRCGVELDSARDQCSRTPQPDIGLDAADVILGPYFVSCQKFLKPEAKEGSSLM
jgi:hypothetical protein